MSAINLSGNASGSGTFTIASPNSNTNYTLALPEEAGTITTSNSPYSTFRNRIINGDMRIDQRNAGASVTPTDGQYSLDRWRCEVAQSSKMSVQQNAGSVTPPAGFKNYLGVTSLSAYAVLTNDYFSVGQLIEGFNVADLGWGAAGAKTVTISFWVRSSLTGTFGGGLVNSGNNRSYPFTYTISVADTWEYKTVTIAGDTSGTWLSTNGTGVQVLFSMGAGSGKSNTAGAWVGSYASSATGAVSVVGTNAATWYITGVQLEVGSVATPFERRPYGTELALCQRYALKYNPEATVYGYIGNGFAGGTTVALISLPLPVQMRAAPTVTSSNLMVQDGITITAATSVVVVANQTNSLNAYVQVTVASGLTTYRPYQLQANNNTAGYLLLSAEL